MAGHEAWKPFALFAMHCAVAAAAIGVGFIPEALLSHRYADTRLAAFFPSVLLTAVLAGFFVNRKEKVSGPGGQARCQGEGESGAGCAHDFGTAWPCIGPGGALG